ncbi:major capsid protein VP54 [Acanthocystis turfacea Chlorella virus WI0606]|nr:major capsid protein VP54 [Acanthocystis turfacea Chlorella virus WI0606]
MGGLTQLIAVGDQDVFLTGDPNKTYWKKTYARYSNFALESIEQDVNGVVNYGNEISIILRKNGDLINCVALQITLQRGNSALGENQPYFPAEHLIEYVEVYIGGQKIFEFDHQWFRMYWELYLTYDQKLAYNTMCDFQNEVEGYERTFYLPLPLWFNSFNNGKAIPLIALQYHEVQIKIKLTQSQYIVGINRSFTPRIRCYADYVFLDPKERIKFAQDNHTYVINQIQRNLFPVTVNTTNNEYNVGLNFNHPVQCLMWALIPSLDTHGQYTGVYGEQQQEVLAPIAEAKISFNGIDRLTTRQGRYFQSYQPWYSSAGQFLSSGVYMYSFGTNIRYGVPSGSMNFSRIDNATLHIITKAAVVSDTTTPATVTETMTTTSAANLTTMMVYANNFNILKIEYGMGGIMFSN